MKKTRVGVIGAGAMGKHHARIYSEMQGAELVGVADVNERAAAEVALSAIKSYEKGENILLNA